MAYPYDGMFYPTLPQDTQDFPAVLSGVGRSLRDFGRGVSYYPMDLAGAVADIGNLPLQGIDYLVNQIRGTDQNYISTDRPFGGSAQLIDAATRLGLSQQPTGSAPETIGRVMAGLINPMAGARAVGRVGDITTEQANRAADALVRQITGNPQATAPQVLQETSMPFMQAVAPRPSGLLETPVKSDLGFYSALEQATIPLQNKGTGSQFLAQIEKTAGVKPEEVKWTGLDEFLKSRQSVTKQEVQDYLAANRVDLQEVRLGEASEGRAYGVFGDEADGFYVSDPDGSRDVAGPFNNIFDAEAAAERFTAKEMESGAKFSSYTLPGGKNYREILLTLPQKGGGEVKLAEQNRDMLAKQTADLMEEWKNLSEQMPGDPRVVNLYQQLAETRRLRDQAVVDARELRKASEAEIYRSSHFYEPNILAHMRVNDRVVDGKKTLFIEEVQSDWHQAGRKKGYDTLEIRAAEQQKLDNIFAKSKELSDEERLLEMRIVNDTSQGKDTPSDIMDRFRDLKKQLGKLQRERYKIEKNFGQGVPDAPFKTSWHELSLKRAIQEASEKGYDQIAFTTGKTQAERYDLSQQVGQITARPTPDGKIALEALTPDMKEQVISKVVMENELDDIVGKEIADKIRTQVEYPKNFDDRGKSVELSGLDLQVGGEGMKGFYDQILPKSLEKLGKKFDAKVGKTEMDGVEVWKMDITPKMRESVLTKGQPLFAATPAGLGLLGSEEE